jgi:hypothetical protein
MIGELGFVKYKKNIDTKRNLIIWLYLWKK